MWDNRAKRSDKRRTGKGDDGDTVLLISDLGRGVFDEAPIRLKGCFAPESSHPGGKESAKFLDLTLDDIEERATAHGHRWPFVVITEKNTNPEPDEVRSFVRYVGVLYAADTGECVNDQVAAFLAQHPEWGGGIGSLAAEDG
jgi:hypothetical protein